MTLQPIGPSDDELIARARRGDGDAFGKLYERYLDTIYRYVLHRVSDVTEAEDLTETTFLKAQLTPNRSWFAEQQFEIVGALA